MGTERHLVAIVEDSDKEIEVRKFYAFDFTRAWRTMRCWAWRNDFKVMTPKKESQESYEVILSKQATANNECGDCV